MGLREEILASVNEPKFIATMVNGQRVRVYALSLGEMNKFNAETRRRSKKERDRVNETPRMIIACVRDEKGEPIFTAADEDAILAMPMPDTERLTRIALDVNGLTPKDDGDDAGN